MISKQTSKHLSSSSKHYKSSFRYYGSLKQAASKQVSVFCLLTMNKQAASKQLSKQELKKADR